MDFSQIVDSKANSIDFQNLLHSLLTAKQFREFQQS